VTVADLELLAQFDLVFSAALHLCGHRAEAQDLAQETFARAFAARDRFREGTSARAWLLAILSRLYTDRRRDEGRHPATGLERELPAPEVEELPRWRTLSPETVRAALLGLPRHFREPIVLVDLLGLSYRDVAFMLGVRAGTVMSRLSRGREQLKAALLGGMTGAVFQPAPVEAARA
jgi:RNA polymerase sigma-70 factor (ECF subfamily)